ncbi:uncharacterized protein LOC119998955 isoform X2 [Tripterygium wilfordii]|uniref:uncharacterized protein LOC119998955 isoform X2 n=1 Tax=Tripterygium wilfordii TaxID=458696 RepID=UPI0018F7EC22|nr:uncharacterized protein LOC119998955 isoform X2 [Tripterygium wilfordii]
MTVMLKQDTEEFRVMYREGSEGTPFHTFLFEGYVDAPVDACLCISWESELYRKWWPQFSFPSFKILTSKCLKKVRIGEQLSLVRVKVSWPLSAREAIVHYFLLEYFQHDLIVILLNTIADLEGIDKSTHGFTNEGIPEANDVVRIDLVGGFVIQKVTSERSYFRTLANIDMKLDFVPPSLINFITRQLVGSGFKLYQKASTSVSANDEDYGKVLGEPMYARIREALYSKNESNEDLKEKNIKDDLCIPPKEHIDLGPMKEKVQNVHLVEKSSSEHGELMHNNAFGEAEEIRLLDHLVRDTVEESHIGCDANECSLNNSQYTDRKAFGEIEEEVNENRRDLDKDGEDVVQPPSNAILEKKRANGEKNITIRHEVVQALGTLEKAISIVRERRLNGQSRSLGNFAKVEVPYLGKGSVEELTTFEDGGVCSNSETGIEVAKKETLKRTSHESKSSSGIHEVRSSLSNSFSRDHNRIVPASPEQELSVPDETSDKALYSTGDGPTVIAVLDQSTRNNKQTTTDANGANESGLAGERLSQLRKRILCCFQPGYGSRSQAEGRSWPV